MAREFSVGGDGLTLANQAVTLVFINPHAAVAPMLNILRIWASQAAAAAGQQRIQVETQVTAFPTLVSATPRNLKRSDTTASVIVGGTAGAAGTCGINASAEGAGAKKTKRSSKRLGAPHRLGNAPHFFDDHCAGIISLRTNLADLAITARLACLCAGIAQIFGRRYRNIMVLDSNSHTPDELSGLHAAVLLCRLTVIPIKKLMQRMIWIAGRLDHIARQ
jgi:hypothetical protein